MLRSSVLLFFLSLLFDHYAQTSTLQLSGKYDGRDLYFQNPETEVEGTFTTISLSINGQFYPEDSLNQSAFRIIPSLLGIQEGEMMYIEIMHHAVEKPRLLAPFGPPANRLSVKNVHLDSLGTICWDVQGTEDVICFKVQRYCWNKWIGEGTVCTVFGDTTYCHDVYPMHGENSLRIISEDGAHIYASETLRFYSDVPKITYNFDKQKKLLQFSQYTLFELYDASGNVLLENFQQQVDLANFQKGRYYLNYGNSTTTLRIR